MYVYQLVMLWDGTYLKLHGWSAMWFYLNGLADCWCGYSHSHVELAYCESLVQYTCKYLYILCVDKSAIHTILLGVHSGI